jgi:hypothetical protein
MKQKKENTAIHIFLLLKKIGRYESNIFYDIYNFTVISRYDCPKTPELEYIRPLPDPRDSSIPSHGFENCKAKMIVFHNDIEKINFSAFSNSDFSDIVFPDCLEHISGGAFAGCYKVKKLALPSSLRVIGDYAFCGNDFEQLTIPDSVELIDENAFAYNHSLRKVTFGTGITFLSQCIFDDCVNLNTVIIPNTIKNINMCAFRDCKSLVTIYIPDSVGIICEHAFFGCESLKEISIPKGCLYNTDPRFPSFPPETKVIERDV